MTFTKQNAADNGFNRWEINGLAYPNTMAMTHPSFRLREGRRYRIQMRNASVRKAVRSRARDHHRHTTLRRANQD
jgi:hypothetical protein